MHVPTIVAFVRSLLQRRVVRYAIVGAIGVPINLGFLFVFGALLHGRLDGAWADRLASALAFEASAVINLVGNQLFTYHEQKHVSGREWLRRGIKLQMANITLAWLITQLVREIGGVNKYLAQALGIGGKFIFSFLFANRFVYRPTTGNDQPAKHNAGSRGVNIESQ